VARRPGRVEEMLRSTMRTGQRVLARRRGWKTSASTV